MAIVVTDENGHERVEKCIHEGLDMPYCDCPDDVRQRLNVKLPRPEELPENGEYF